MFIIRPGPRIEKDKGYFIIMVNEPYEPEYTIKTFVHYC